MTLTEEAITRVINTVEKRIERNFNINVTDTSFQDKAFNPGHMHTVRWHGELSVRSTGEIDWHEVYEAINRYEFLYNGDKYVSKVASSSNGAEGRIRIKVDEPQSD